MDESDDEADVAHAVLDRDGVVKAAGPAPSRLLRIREGDVAPVAVPDGPSEVWEATRIGPHRVISSLRARADGGWDWSVHPEAEPLATEETIRSFGMLASQIAEDARLDAVVRRLSVAAMAPMRLSGTVIVLMDADGAPTFAGGPAAERFELAAMEASRARGAPMTIWHAFHDDRIVVERGWRRRVLTDDRFIPVRPFVAESELDVYAAVPLRVHGVVGGVLAGLATDPAGIGPRTITTWDRVAFELGQAIRTADAVRRARGQGADRERARLNDDLHASVSQTLFALRLRTAGLRAGQAPSEDLVADVRGLVDDAVSEVREVITQRRQLLEGTPLSEQLVQITDALSRAHGLAIRVRCPGIWDDLTVDCADDVVRVVKETLRNVVKHAAASQAEVSLRREAGHPDRLVVEVADDGVAFDAGGSSREGHGFGLESIERLVRERDGRVEVQEGPPKRVIVRLHAEFESEWSIVARGLTTGDGGD